MPVAISTSRERPRRRRALLRAAAGLLAAGCLLACAGGAPPEAKVTASGGEVRVEATAGEVVVWVDSPRGIGRARVEFLDGRAPQRVVLRFRLKGLEQLVFRYPGAAVTASISSAPERTVRESVQTGGAAAAQAIAPGDAHWMEMAVTPEGDIQVVAPRSWSEAGGPAFEIEWIDFFR